MRKVLVVLVALAFTVAFCGKSMLHQGFTFAIYETNDGFVSGFFYGFRENFLNVMYDGRLCFLVVTFDTVMYLELCSLIITFKSAPVPERYRNLTAIVVGKEKFLLAPTPTFLDNRTIMWNVEGGSRILDALAKMDYPTLAVYSGNTHLMTLTTFSMDIWAFLEKYRYYASYYKKFRGR